jgi:hypothetical protein
MRRKTPELTKRFHTTKTQAVMVGDYPDARVCSRSGHIGNI